MCLIGMINHLLASFFAVQICIIQYIHLYGNFIYSPERKFSREKGFSWKANQNSQTEFPNGKCAFHLPVLVFPSLVPELSFLQSLFGAGRKESSGTGLSISRPFGLDRLWSYLPEKSRGNGTSASPWKFPFGTWRVPFTTTIDQPVFQSKW